MSAEGSGSAQRPYNSREYEDLEYVTSNIASLDVSSGTVITDFAGYLQLFFNQLGSGSGLIGSDDDELDYARGLNGRSLEGRCPVTTHLANLWVSFFSTYTQQ